MVVFQQETATPHRSGRIYVYVYYVQFTQSTLLPNNQCDIYSNEHLDNMTEAADLEQRESLQPAENSSNHCCMATSYLSNERAQFPHPDADASGRSAAFHLDSEGFLLQIHPMITNVPRHIQAVGDIIQL